MNTPLSNKSSVDEIRGRFDADVERFSRLEMGQSATMDAPLVLDLLAEAAVVSVPRIRRVLDLGCGAGNNSLRLAQAAAEPFEVDLLDLSEPMVRRATDRFAAATQCRSRGIVGDFREVDLAQEAYDVVLAAAVLHHLRDDADWFAAFAKLHRIVAPGGGVWISDLISHEMAGVQTLMERRYGEYLIELGGEAYRDQVFTYIDREDSPRPVTYQLELLRRVGFDRVEILHKNATFAAFFALKRGRG